VLILIVSWLNRPEVEKQENEEIVVSAYWADSNETKPQWSFQPHLRLFTEVMIRGVKVQALLLALLIAFLVR